MILDELRWFGHAWPAASINGKVPVVFKATDGSATARVEALDIRTTGEGRRYFLFEPLSFWRSFSEINPLDETAVLAFVRRRGDPFGVLAPGTPSDTGAWADLIKLLSFAAVCWDATPERVESDFFPGEVEHLAKDQLSASRYIDEVSLQRVPNSVSASKLPSWDLHPDSSVDLTGIGIVAQSLAGYMVGSALADIENQQDMARCPQCRDWFAFKRKDARFCSASCRALYSTAKKEEK